MHSSQRLLVVLACLLLAGAAAASVTVTCDVETKTGFSYGRSITREVQFVTGRELNRATNSFDYSMLDNYALLWFSQSEVAILKHDGYAIGITGDFDTDDLNRLFRVFGEADFKQINGSTGTQYRITCKRFGRWIDNRLN